MKPTCPRCLEVIKAGATRCPHCQADIDPDEYMVPILAAQEKRKRLGWRIRFAVRCVFVIGFLGLTVGIPSYRAHQAKEAAIEAFTANGWTRQEVFDLYEEAREHNFVFLGDYKRKNEPMMPKFLPWLLKCYEHIYPRGDLVGAKIKNYIAIQHQRRDDMPDFLIMLEDYEFLDKEKTLKQNS